MSEKRLSQPKLLAMRTGRAELRYEREALSTEEAAEFAALAAQGIRDVERTLGLRGSARLRFEVRSGAHISTTRGRTILLAAHRVRARTAPYLHEIAHVLLPCRHAPEWFSEGLAGYIESTVSERSGGYDSHLFTPDGNRGVDGDAGRWLADTRGRAVLVFVGTRGSPAGIVADRHNVAAPFYVLSHSLVKYLAERAGLPVLVRLASARRFAAALRRATGKTGAAWRGEWLRALRPEEK